MGRSPGAGGFLLSVGDFALEDVFRGAREREGGSRDFEDIAASGGHPDGSADQAEFFGDERGGGDAGSAGEGFGLDAALICPNGEGGGSRDLDEIGVGPGGGEQGVMAEEGAEGGHIHRGQMVDHADGVGNAAVDEMEGRFAVFPQDGKIQAPILGGRQVEADPREQDFGADKPGGGFDAHVGGGRPDFESQPRDAAGPVAA